MFRICFYGNVCAGSEHWEYSNFVPQKKCVHTRNSTVRVYHPWNSWYFPTEMLGIQVSPVLVGDKDGEPLLCMATWLHLSVRLDQIPKKEKNENIITDEIGVSDLFPKFIVLKSKEELLQNCHLL